MYPDPQDPTIPATARHEQIAAMHHQHGRQLERRVERRARAAPETSEDACSFAWLQLLTHTSIDLDAPSWRALGWLTQTATREAWRLKARRRRDGLLDHVALEGELRLRERTALGSSCCATISSVGEITAMSIAIDAAERQHHAALHDISQLVETAQISADEGAGLESETNARFVAPAHELELRGAEIVDSGSWTRRRDQVWRLSWLAS